MQERGWVIERWVNSELRYWTGCSTTDESFLPDSDKAIRFAREQDAATVLCWCLDGMGRCCEHVWTPTRADAKQGGQ